MKREKSLIPVFVEFIPDALEEGNLYVSMEYATAVHKCCCGCGKEVVTPLSPADWNLNFNGKGISLYPSIGNWSFPCRSHYWIKNNKVQWAEQWSQARVAAGRDRERLERERYFSGDDIAEEPATPPQTPRPVPTAKPAWWKAWWSW